MNTPECPKCQALIAALEEMLLLNEDWLPDVGICTLQNYQRLNEAPIAARKAIADAQPA